MAPASDRNVPAWTSATRVPPPRSADQCDRVVMPIAVSAVPGSFRRASSKSRWKAEAVGWLWPWYFDPSAALPYGRSTGLDIRKKLIWPIRMPE